MRLHRSSNTFSHLRTPISFYFLLINFRNKLVQWLVADLMQRNQQQHSMSMREWTKYNLCLFPSRGFNIQTNKRWMILGVVIVLVIIIATAVPLAIVLPRKGGANTTTNNGSLFDKMKLSLNFRRTILETVEDTSSISTTIREELTTQTTTPVPLLCNIYSLIPQSAFNLRGPPPLSQVKKIFFFYF